MTDRIVESMNKGATRLYVAVFWSGFVFGMVFVSLLVWAYVFMYAR